MAEMKNKFSTFLKWLIFAGLFVYIIILLRWWIVLPAKSVLVTIPDGATTKEIAGLLHKSGVISSKFFFVEIVKVTNKTKRLKAGSYVISPRASIFKVINILAKGDSEYKKITIPEGYNSKQIAELLSLNGLILKEDFLNLVEKNKLEGYLFPQTYRFSPGITAEMIINIMHKEFYRNFTEQMAQRAKELSMTENQIITLASIIEKEAVVAQERNIIAGVFYNRLRKKWNLESCATVLYALGGHKDRLSLDDVKIDSPYNTYRHGGLPPGPICSPGVESIKAALYPAQTEDMFFVATGTGTHIFSKYFTEHIKNKRKANKK